MANVELSVAGAAKDITATAADDVVTINDMGSDGTFAAHTFDGGAGDDTLVLGGVLGTDFDAIANGFEVTGGGDDSITATATEAFEFDNGTVTFAASVNPEWLSISALEQDAGSDWNVTDVLEYDGSSVGNAAGDWSLSTVNGSALTTGNTVTVLDGTTVLGTLTTDGTNLTFDADTNFEASLNVGETSNVSFEVVLTNDLGDTFTETFTAVVTGSESEGDDTLISAAGVAEDVDLLGGDDFAVGNDGADTIFGEDGNDTIYAGGTDDDADLLVGGNDDDILAGGAGDDIIIGDEYVISGAPAANSIALGVTADVGVNQLFGGAGNDIIAIGGYTNAADAVISNSSTIADATGDEGGEAYGGAGNDFILGTATGADLVGMGDGNDTVVLGDGNDTVYAGADDTGADEVTIADGDNTVFTGAGGDDVTTGAGADVIGLGDGDDTVVSGGGNDTIYAGAGNDDIQAGGGNDAIYGGDGNDTIDAAGGSDTVYGGAGNDDIALAAAAGSDVIVFASGDDSITGFESGTDQIDLTALELGSLDEAVIIEDTATPSTTIIFSDDNTITYDATFDADDFLL